MPFDLTLVTGFIIAATAVIVSPGPDTLLILRYTLIGGRRLGLATVAGVQLGLIGHILMAVVGLTLLVAASPTAFRAIAIAGAFYLAWIAIDALRSGALPQDGASAGPADALPSAARAARNAMITNLLNPKVLLLFIAIMPNFVDTKRGSLGVQLAFLGALLILINIVWQAILVAAAAPLRRWMRQRSFRRSVDWITAIIFLGFAGLILFDHVV